ncbi:MAG: ATP-binding protein [Nitrospiraceae bacterium]
MEPNETESSQALRDKTDKSLGSERDKTDGCLEEKSRTVEEEASETIRLNRLSADKDRESQRAEVDLDKEHQLDVTGIQTSRLDDKLLIQERERSDKAQNVERKKEDHARRQERFQKRLITEGLLENERRETDSNLLDERVCSDAESKHNSSLLSDETVSHDFTRAALVTRDQFLAIVSHDLQNSLVAISISAHLMRSDLSRGTVDAVRLLEHLGIIEQTTAGMDRMISDLLDVERMAQDKLILKLERVDLRAILQECVDLFAPVVSSKSFSMTIHTGPEPIYANLDHDRIFQVLSNLIGNSLKFTPRGGTIKISARKQDTQVEISVTDNGPGIPEQAKAQVFERFSQLKIDGRRGLGLGLFIAKWIVDAHQGRIWLTSEVGKGTTSASRFHYSHDLNDPDLPPDAPDVSRAGGIGDGLGFLDLD